MSRHLLEVSKGRDPKEVADELFDAGLKLAWDRIDAAQLTLVEVYNQLRPSSQKAVEEVGELLSRAMSKLSGEIVERVLSRSGGDEP